MKAAIFVNISSQKKLRDCGNGIMMGMNKRRGLVFLVLYCVLLLISLGVVAFGLVMLKIAYDLHHPMEFLAVFFAASLVILIGGAMALGFGLKAVQWLRKKVKNTS
jgi:cytochrome c biogenesis protein CcdA